MAVTTLVLAIVFGLIGATKNIVDVKDSIHREDKPPIVKQYQTYPDSAPLLINTYTPVKEDNEDVLQ